MSLTLISSGRFAEHQTPPGHPEREARAGVMNAIASQWQASGGDVVTPRAATEEQLARVHAPEYIRQMAATTGRTLALDPDTHTSSKTQEIALLAAGAAVDAVEIVMGMPPVESRIEPRAQEDRPNAGARGSRVPGRADVRAALAMVRPPGHHAERSRAMGFCIYNNVAVAAAHARALGVPRVAIVDYDVHHGNGTQHMFEADPNVLYISLHQFPFYPGTGAADEIGRAAGRGFTVNLPIEAGAIDEDYRVLFSRIVLPVLQQFAPNLLLVSAGFDAHERDPLAGMRLTTGAFGAMTMELRGIAEAFCDGRLILVTEGGYDLDALASSLATVVESLATSSTEAHWPTSGVPPDRGRASATRAARALGPFWTLE